MIEELRRNLDIEEFDYTLLMSHMKDYRKPLDKISRLLRSGDIVRVKKGLYVFGEKYRRGPICLESVANLIYGPSYISLEYALSFHGMIPERVEWVTSMTTQKNKKFKTPIGNFSYQHLHSKKYSVGVYQYQVDKYHYCMMAHKEKALADLLNKMTGIQDHEEMRRYLTEEIRVEEEKLLQLDLNRLRLIADAYKNSRVELLYTLIAGKS